MKNNTKKLILGFGIASALLPFVAFAQTDVTLLSSSQNVNVGDKVTVAVTVSPDINKSAYTSKVALNYSTDVLEVTGFTFAPNWLPLSQPGYDTMGNGMVIKTAGYPGGLSQSILFGTVTFKVVKSGTAKVAVTSDTTIYDRDNNDIYSGSNNTVLVTAIDPVVLAQLTETPPTITKNEELGETATSTVATSTPSEETMPTSTEVAAVGLSGIVKNDWWIAVLVIVILGVGYGFMRNKKQE